ncbi:Hypothetical protein D9617_10g072350 [Elsinoe fawcettii]|nr:Hypothetical protein D9617_10g072350 [Elsinoe fawcettii]
MSKAAAASNLPTVRLHISPFSPALLDSILPRAKQSLATSVSYHKTQSDPDKGFGYLELPTDEASKLRSKLNGAILKGSKMSIEKARPEKRKAMHKEDEPEVERPQKKAKKRAKPEDANKEISGVELPTDRKVKRGWTEPNAKAGKKDKDAKEVKRERSKYTDKEELLFRTGKKVTEPKSKSKTAAKSQKSKTLVVHEFEKTTKVPTFIKQTASEKKSRPLTFVDGQGWVDEEGSVVEEVRSTRRSAKKIPTEGFAQNALGIKGLETGPRAELKEESAVAADAAAKESSATSDSASSTSESEVSSDSDSDSDSDSSEASADSTSQRMTPPTAVEPDQTTTKLVSQTVIAPSTEAPTPALDDVSADSMFQKPVHPLEALYKRRPEDLPKPAPIKTSFSFFEADNEEPPPNAESNTIPQTPFTQQDLRFRGLRSAAPTPDTAVASRKFFAEMDDEDDEEEDQAQASSAADAKSTTEKSTATNEKSAWRKGFYERRSELNSSWKQRRRDAMKQQRQRESRRLSRRAL